MSQSSLLSVAIDACCLGRRKTGNETYVKGLLDGLLELIAEQHPAVENLKIWVITTPAYEGPRSEVFQWITIPLGNFLPRNFISIPNLLKAKGVDVFRGSYWNRFWAQPCPTTLMVHDLSFVSFPQGFHRHEQFVYANLVRQCAIRSKEIVTVSEFSRSEIARHWKIDPARITVTYNGISEDFCPREHPVDPCKGDILYVGNLHPRKNLPCLLDAFVSLKRNRAIPNRLRIVGQATWMAGEVFAAVRKHGLEDQVDFTGYVSDPDLVKEYQRAAVLVYPSLYEGFGLPPLEAMACGCPVVTSNTTSLPEVTGNAALLAPPTDPQAIADRIFEVLGDRATYQTLRQAGLGQSAKFRWRHCALATIPAWRRCAAA